MKFLDLLHDEIPVLTSNSRVKCNIKIQHGTLKERGITPTILHQHCEVYTLRGAVSTSFPPYVLCTPSRNCVFRSRRDAEAPRPRTTRNSRCEREWFSFWVCSDREKRLTSSWLDEDVVCDSCRTFPRASTVLVCTDVSVTNVSVKAMSPRDGAAVPLANSTERWPEALHARLPALLCCGGKALCATPTYVQVSIGDGAQKSVCTHAR